MPIVHATGNDSSSRHAVVLLHIHPKPCLLLPRPTRRYKSNQIHVSNWVEGLGARNRYRNAVSPTCTVFAWQRLLNQITVIKTCRQSFTNWGLSVSFCRVLIATSVVHHEPLLAPCGRSFVVTLLCRGSNSNPSFSQITHKKAH